MNGPAGGGAPPGRFLVLEGPDGGGKSTQASRLTAWLRGRARTVLHLRDPGGTRLGERIREILLDREHVEIRPRTEALLFLASRAQLVEERIRPAIAAGEVVVCERWLHSTVAYQGYAGGMDPEEIWSMGRVAAGGLEPDLALVLDVPSAVGIARIPGERDLLESRSAAFHEAVRNGYLEIARAGRMGARLIAPGSVEQVERRIREAVDDVL